MTGADWLEIWLNDFQAESIDRTVHKHRCIFDRHFVPVIGPVKMTQLSDIHIQRIISHLKKSLLADSTIKNYMGIFCAALNQAVRSKIIYSNPAAQLKLSNKPKKEFHIIDRDKLNAFFEAAKQTRYPVELCIGILTGLRAGEIRGLRWKDVDFDAKTIYIRQQIKPKQKGMQRIGLPKYGKTRLLHLPDEAMLLLRQQRKRQAEQRLVAGMNWREDGLGPGLVFRQANGSEHGHATITRAVKIAGDLIGIPELHPHDLRHSYAVALLRAGADVKTIQHNLGHASVRMTLDVYAAYTQDAGLESAEMLSKYIREITV